MQQESVKLDAARAWNDAIAMLKAAPDVLLTVTGFFILLPSLLLDTLRPFTFSGTRGALMAEMMAWTQANFLWIVIVALIGALGRLILLIMLIEPARPTAGESLSAAIRLLPLFVLTDIAVGLLWLGSAMLFLLPWFYVIGRTYLAEAAFVAERARTPINAVASGFEASRGNGWRIFAMVAIIYVAGTILTAAVSSVVGVIGALFGGTGFDVFLDGFVQAALGSGVSLILLLVSVASWRQLAQNRNMRRSVAR